jgi:NTP pyrophosphatase (non-canonical NTP hydrolase)
MERFYKMAKGTNKLFPNGVEPFQIATRLLEECGEVASEVNHWENSGFKRKKKGEPSKENLAGEIRQALQALFQLVIYYGVEKELDSAINAFLEYLKSEGLIEDSNPKGV